MRNAFRVHPQRREYPYLYLLAWKTANIGRKKMNPGIRIPPLTSANDLHGGQMNGYRPGQLLGLRMGNYP